MSSIRVKPTVFTTTRRISSQPPKRLPGSLQLPRGPQLVLPSRAWIRNLSTRVPQTPKEESLRASLTSPPSPDQSRKKEGDDDHSPSAPVRQATGAGGATFAFPITSSPAIDAALTTLLGLGMVFLGGVAYVAWYKKRVLDKIEQAFAPGYDPALELANHGKRGPGVEEDQEIPTDDVFWPEHLRRKEQALVDKIIKAEEVGHYFLLIGPKRAQGAGKTSMIFDAMKKINADGIAVCDVHPDLEVFRLRLGKAINFEFNEDSQTGLFQRRDPREGGPALDIERALNKLEKVALRSSRKKEKPLVLVFNNIHLLQNDNEGRNILLQLQQRAESWAESGIMTIVFSTDDFWPFLALRKTSNRMQVLSIYDLKPVEAFHALQTMRRKITGGVESEGEVRRLIGKAGGRLAHLSKIAKARDMTAMADHLLENEKAWLLSQIGLINDCDDDVMDEQKWSSTSWLLLREFCRLRSEQIANWTNANPASALESTLDLPMPSIPYWRCRQIMTRPDFLEVLDRLNVIQIDVHHDVRPDSMLVLQAAMEVVAEDGFDDLLENVLNRVNEIESLHRTRELTFKDLSVGDRIRLEVNKRGSHWFYPF